MPEEVKTLFSLEGRLANGDRVWDGIGQLSVVERLTNHPDPFAGRWTKNERNDFLSLGFSATKFAWQVLFAAVDQSFVPNNLEIAKIMICRSDSELKAYLLRSGIAITNNW